MAEIRIQRGSPARFLVCAAVCMAAACLMFFAGSPSSAYQNPSGADQEKASQLLAHAQELT
ncbi:MAG: hypothetical protein ACRD2O_16455, partial [Terriglobia bacterium]